MRAKKGGMLEERKGYAKIKVPTASSAHGHFYVIRNALLSRASF